MYQIFKWLQTTGVDLTFNFFGRLFVALLLQADTLSQCLWDSLTLFRGGPVVTASSLFKPESCLETPDMYSKVMDPTLSASHLQGKLQLFFIFCGLSEEQTTFQSDDLHRVVGCNILNSQNWFLKGTLDDILTHSEARARQVEIYVLPYLLVMVLTIWIWIIRNVDLVVALLNWTPIVEWYMQSLWLRMNNKKICVRMRFGLCAQIILTILGSVVNTIWRA
jgi:hypothetical protein